MSDRTSILISCLQTESELIHEQARGERRSLSGYVLHVVLGGVRFDEHLYQSFPNVLLNSPGGGSGKTAGPRTTLLVRCSCEESERIRAAAKRRDISISGYVLTALRRSWTVKLGRAPWHTQAWHRKNAPDQGRATLRALSASASR